MRPQLDGTPNWQVQGRQGQTCTELTGCQGPIVRSAFGGYKGDKVKPAPNLRDVNDKSYVQPITNKLEQLPVCALFSY